ncbi:MAG TPA: hypothetical protein VGI70_21800 [Polyangiales bacterium]
MSDQAMNSKQGSSDHTADEPLWCRRALLCGLLVLVCIRSFVFVRFHQSHFDADQAVFGLMAKDLAERRALPIFMYGQHYLLAVSVWASAPLYLVLGTNIATLKLPTLMMNLAAVVMLWCGLRREPRMNSVGAAIAILPFAVPGVVTSSRLVEHAGGNIEPFVFTIAMFLLRERAVVLGVCAGIGFLNREFSADGLIALLVIDLVTGKLRARLYPRALTIAVASVTVWIVEMLGAYGAEYHGEGPAIGGPAWENSVGFFDIQLPALLGGLHRALHDYNITSTLVVGHWQLYALFGAWVLVVVFALVRWFPTLAELDGMSFYLVLVGGGQALAYMLFTPTPLDPMLVRYVLLVLLAIVGLAAFGWRRPIARYATVCYVLIASCWNLGSNLRLIQEYRAKPPQRDLDLLTAELQARGVQYLRADYWTAYDVTWSSGMRIIASPDRGQTDRIQRYHSLFDAHREAVYNLSSQHCRHGTPILHWYLCGPRPKKHAP